MVWDSISGIVGDFPSMKGMSDFTYDIRPPPFVFFLVGSMMLLSFRMGVYPVIFGVLLSGWSFVS